MAMQLGGTTGITVPATATNQSGAVAWVNFNGLSGASPVIRGSYNVTSVTRTGTGAYTITFTTALADANYAIVGSADYAGTGTPVVNSGTSRGNTAASAFVATYQVTTGAALDVSQANIVVFR